MKIGYARVSTKDQHLGLQIDALKKAGCEKIYQDVASGARSERPALNEMINNLRSGDVLVIWKLDRLGRTLNHLIVLVNDLMEKKLVYKACTIPLTPPRPKAG
jgi:DNA invertase Pin-like site-specific DNA recombinase